jgi:DNA invertase Pin-like site-specific DNA recombinase
MSALAEFERDLLRERVRSGIAAARKARRRVWPDGPASVAKRTVTRLKY